MESLAFLHLAQDYENPECKELSVLSNSFDLLSRSPSKSFSSAGAIALLTVLSTTWVASLAQVSSAEAYRSGGDGYYDGPFRVRPNGDQPFSDNCSCATNICGDYRPVRPQPIDPDFRPIRPQPINPDFRPVRPTGDVFLRRGDVGSDVRYVQDLLRSAGYFDASSTGFYATLTQRGVEAFQRDRGLGIDGIVGPETLAALESRATS